jgi:hypothetical protein
VKGLFRKSARLRLGHAAWAGLLTLLGRPAIPPAPRVGRSGPLWTKAFFFLFQCFIIFIKVLMSVIS